MIPLWTTAIFPVQSVNGWALVLLGTPCVAHRVCPIAHVPLRVTESFAAEIFPVSLKSAISGDTAAIPKESYPRYSRRSSPSIQTSAAFLYPMYPTMPHISHHPCIIRDFGFNQPSAVDVYIVSNYSSAKACECTNCCPVSDYCSKTI